MKRTFLVRHESGFYFRIVGYGLSIDSNRRVGFSERYGYRRVLRIGRWAIEWLTPQGMPS